MHQTSGRCFAGRKKVRRTRCGLETASPCRYTGTGSQFPNRIASGALSSDQRSIDRWFDASAFVAPAQYVFGNSGRNILYGPGTRQIDMSLFKSFAFAESRRLEFRAEAFNGLNTPQFNNPSS